MVFGVANTSGSFGANGVNVLRGESQTDIGTIFWWGGSIAESFLSSETSTQVDGPNSDTYNTLGGDTAARQSEGQSSGNAQAASGGTGKWISADTAINWRTDATESGASSSGTSNGSARGSTRDGSLYVGYHQVLSSRDAQGSALGSTQSKLSGEDNRLLGTTSGVINTVTTPFWTSFVLK